MALTMCCRMRRRACACDCGGMARRWGALRGTAALERGVEFGFANEEPELEAHVSFGLRPGFALASLDAAEVLLPEGTYRRHWAPGNFLDGRVDIVRHAGGPMPFDKSALPGSYLIELTD